MTLPLVLLPGMMCDARLFAPQLAAFSHERPVTVAPLLGGISIADIARNLLEQLPQAFALAGLSMGGIVAMEMIRQAPGRIPQLALMDTNHRAESSARKAERAPQIAAAQAGNLRAIMRDEMKPNYLAEGPNTGAILDLCMAMADTLGADAFVDQSTVLASRPDQTETLESTTAKTLVLCGEHDTLCPVDAHRDMADLIPNATLSIIADAGHLPTLENPEHTNAALSDWLQNT